MEDYLDPYRRHLATCEHREKGQQYSLCSCPIHVYGYLQGQPFRRSLRTTDWNAAQRRIELLLVYGLDAELLPSSPRRTVSVAVASYLQDAVERNLKPSSIRSYRQTLDRLTKHCGKLPVSVLDAEILREFQSSSMEFAPRTRRKQIEYLRAFCAFCQVRGWLTSNPAKLLKGPKITTLGTLPFSREEIRKLLQACDEIRGMWKSDTPAVRLRSKALVLGLLYSGLRIGDVAQLQRAALEPSGHLHLRTMKTSVPLKVLLHPDAAEALRRLPAPGGNPTYFFWSGRGDIRHCITSLQRTLARLGKLAGVHAHAHRARDTFAVDLLTRGADIRTVSHLLGHESIRTTEKHYAHFMAEHQRILDQAVSTLDFREQPVGPPLLVSPFRRTGN